MLLLENVKNLVEMENGDNIARVCNMLVECGYNVTYKVLAADEVAGLAQ